MKYRPTITPIISNTIEWHNFIRTINEQTNKSPTRLLDASGKSVGDLSSFIGALGAFHLDLDPNESLKRDHLLKHIHFGFIIEFVNNDDLIDVLQASKLNIVTNKNNLAIVSGTLLDWKNACLLFCQMTYSMEVRYTFDAIYLYFCSIGLTNVFYKINKAMTKDGTFILEDHRK